MAPPVVLNVQKPSGFGGLRPLTPTGASCQTPGRDSSRVAHSASHFQDFFQTANHSPDAVVGFEVVTLLHFQETCVTVLLSMVLNIKI